MKIEKSDGFNSNINELEITEIIENRIKTANLKLIKTLGNNNGRKYNL